MARPPRARQPLRKASLELFVEQGIHATGIRDIARHAGCSEAALYRHWTNKDDLVFTLYREHVVEVVRILDEAIASEKTFPARIRAAARACYKLYDEDPLVFRFVLLVQHELARRLPEDLRMPQDLIIALVREAQEAGFADKHADAALISAHLIGCFLETANYVLYGRLPGPLSRYADAVAVNVVKLLEK